jgi:cell division septal protein FtsQ
MQKTQIKRLPHKVKLVVILTFCTIVFLSLLFFSSRWVSSKPIRLVSVSGNELIPRDEIINQIDTHSLSSNDFLLSIKSKVKAHPYIQNTVVSHKQADELSVEIKEKKPLALIITENGETCLIDKDNNILPFKNYKNCISLPVLRGVFYLGNPDTVSLTGFYTILDALSQKKEIMNYFISEIIYDREKQTYSMLSADNNINIFLGTTENIENKITFLNDFLLTKKFKTNFSKIDYIDLSWKNLIAVHERPEQVILTQQLELEK